MMRTLAEEPPMRRKQAVFYHVTPQANVEKMRGGIHPPGPPEVGNAKNQYGYGFYVFRERRDAERYKGVQEKQGTRDLVIVEICVSSEAWDAMKPHTVPLEQDEATDRVRWGVPGAVPPEWMEKYDVLEGKWGVTPGYEEMKDTWQIKFNPHTFEKLRLCEVMAMNEETPTLSPEELARGLHVSPESVVRAIEEHRLEAERIGDTYAIRLPALQEFLRGGNPFTVGVRQFPVGGASRPSDSDETVMGWVQTGDEAAFGELMRRYHRRVYALCRWLVDELHAEDLTQDAFIRLFQARGQFELRRPLWPWLSRITFNLCVDHLRPRLRDKFIHVSLDEPLGNGTADGLDWSDVIPDTDVQPVVDQVILSHIRTAVVDLPLDERVDLLTILTPGGSLHELARRREITYNGAKKRGSGALRHLEANLRDEGMEVKPSEVLFALGEVDDTDRKGSN
jgi:RNA polymerase sigma factor (sigma-70 family)